MKNGKTYKFGIYLDMTAKAIKQDILRRFRENGITLTPEQWAVLSVLRTRDHTSQKDLADFTFKDAPTVSRIIDLLNNKGLLVRTSDPKDRRKFNVSLTEEGRELINRSEPIIMEARAKGWEGLNDTDYHELKRILDTIYSNINYM